MKESMKGKAACSKGPRSVQDADKRISSITQTGTNWAELKWSPQANGQRDRAGQGHLSLFIAFRTLIIVL